MLEATIDSVNAYWAATFGCDVSELRPPHGVAVAHQGLGDYAGVYAMAFGDNAPIASVPRVLAPQVQHIARQWRSKSIRRPGEIAAVLGEQAGVVIGPARVAYADETALTADSASGTHRPLDAGDVHDVHALQQLRDACAVAEWETGGSDLAHDPVYGIFAGRALAAVAGYTLWGGCIAHIAVITHPVHRGHGQAVVRAVAQAAVARGFVPQYRTLESNTGSCRIADLLGFVPFAMSLAVRMRAGGA